MACHVYCLHLAACMVTAIHTYSYSLTLRLNCIFYLVSTTGKQGEQRPLGITVQINSTTILRLPAANDSSLLSRWVISSSPFLQLAINLLLGAKKIPS